MRRWAANRVAGVGAEPDQSEVRGDRRRGAAARTGGDAIQRVWVLRVAGQNRADGLVGREGELRHVGLGQHDRARRLDPRDQERVAVRDEPLERQRSIGTLQADGLEVVLDDRRHAVERTDGSAAANRRSSSSASASACGLTSDDGVDRRSALVVGRDPRQVLLDQAVAGQAPRAQRRVDLRDRRLLDAERPVAGPWRAAAGGVATSCRQAAERDEDDDEGAQPPHVTSSTRRRSW